LKKNRHLHLFENKQLKFPRLFFKEPILIRVKGADVQPIPSWGFISKTVQFQGKLFTAKSLQAPVAGPNLSIDFLRKFIITVAPEINQVLLAYTAPATATTPLPNVSPIIQPPVSVPPATQNIPDSVPKEVKRLL
jgi:hypothetical protein